MVNAYETANFVFVHQGSLIAPFVRLLKAGLVAGGMRIMCKAASNRNDLCRETLEALLQQGEAWHALRERTALPAKE